MSKKKPKKKKTQKLILRTWIEHKWSSEYDEFPTLSTSAAHAFTNHWLDYQILDISVHSGQSMIKLAVLIKVSGVFEEAN